MTFSLPEPDKWLTFFLIVCCSLGQRSVHAQETAEITDAYEIDADGDDTADIDTESTVDTAYDERGLKFTGDFRPLIDYIDQDGRDGTTINDTRVLARLRVKGIVGVAKGMQVGVRLVGRCTSEDCSPEWVLDRAKPAPNGLSGGQITFDEIYLHIFRLERFNFTFGRQQTRFVQRATPISSVSKTQTHWDPSCNDR